MIWRRDGLCNVRTNFLKANYQRIIYTFYIHTCVSFPLYPIHGCRKLSPYRSPPDVQDSPSATADVQDSPPAADDASASGDQTATTEPSTPIVGVKPLKADGWSRFFKS